MELSKQVCSLELAQKLKELGIRQESYFYWVKGFPTRIEAREGIGSKYTSIRLFSAFTVAELGEMLPDEFPNDSDSQIRIFKTYSMDLLRWYVRYENEVLESVNHCEYADTEADARAKMLIYLIENKLIVL